jgi:hypothetical protein
VRALAAIVLVAVFAAGVEAGTAWTRVRGTSVNVQVRMSTKLPDELIRLGLSRQQEDSLRRILLVGQRQLRGVLQELEPRLQASIDSVDTAIRATLTPEQRERFDAGRRQRGTNQIEIDTVRR